MAENENTNQNQQNSENQNQQQGSSGRGLLLGLIIILILVNGFLGYNYWSTHNEKQDLKVERNQLDSLYTAVQANLNKKKADLKQLKGKNDKLDSLITKREKSIEDQQERIENILRQKRVTQDKLNKAQRQIRKLVAENNSYVSKIDSMQTAIAKLEKANKKLEKNLDQEKEKTEQLEAKTDTLSQKVKLGSLIEPNKITGKGVKTRNNGKEKEVSLAGKTEKIKVCADLEKNRVAEKGNKTYYLRLISPEGSPIAVKSKGSGVFVNGETGEKTPYTKKYTFDYKQKEKRICFYWEQKKEFKDGEYKAELFQKGYLVGESTFELRGGLFDF